MASDREVVEPALRYEGSIQPDDSKGLVLLIVGVTALVYLADAVIKLAKKLTNDGLVIDTTGEEIKIDYDARLPGGFIVIVSNEGTRIYSDTELSSLDSLVDAMKAGR